MDGLLTIDKPEGPTSHDVVGIVRRVLKEKRVGHTGTLDPMASGVLVLVVGRATRLARFFSSDGKTYDATIRLGQRTDTYDALGRPAGPAWAGPWPDRRAIDAALEAFRGTFLQQPPAFSAKKIAGRRSYEMARAGGLQDTAPGSADAPPALPSPVAVTTHAIELLEVRDDLVGIRVACSAGFYVRSLAHDLGGALGTGAHLAALRRTACGDLTLDGALPLQKLMAPDGPDVARSALVPMERMLPELPALALTPDGLTRAGCGRDLGPGDAVAGFPGALAQAGLTRSPHVRLVSPEGRLVGIAEASRAPGLLHPVVVLM